MPKKFENLLYLISCVLLVWFFLSYGEVFVKNMTPEAKYSPLNLFVMLYG